MRPVRIACRTSACAGGCFGRTRPRTARSGASACRRRRSRSSVTWIAIARRVGLDPYEIRALNVVGPGDRLPTGQVLDETTCARECLERAASRTRFQDRWRERRGIGISLYFHGCGFTGSGELKMKSPVTARLLPDGRIEILTAMTDMGQGCAIVFPQIAAAAAGVDFDDLVFAPPDTGLVPNSGPTVASRTTMIVGGLIERAVRQVRETVEKGTTTSSGETKPRFRDLARAHLERHGPLEVTVYHSPPAWQTFDEATYTGSPYPTYAWGCDVVEVDVDPDTYEVRPRPCRRRLRRRERPFIPRCARARSKGARCRRSATRRSRKSRSRTAAT